MNRNIFPMATSELAHQRRNIALDTEVPFRLFSQTVFVGCALSSKTKQLNAAVIGHVMQCPYHIAVILRQRSDRKRHRTGTWAAYRPIIMAKS